MTDAALAGLPAGVLDRPVKLFPLAGRVLIAALGLALLRTAIAAEPQALVDTWQQATNRGGGMAIAVVTADKVTFYQSGKFSGEDVRTIGPDTLFEIGSVTKVFTAILLADAIERGLVKLDDTVGAPFAPSGITYRQLATHTSGLPRMTELQGGDPADPYADYTVAKLTKDFDIAAPKAKEAPPLYSNFGFAVLGQAIAAKNGASWSAVLKDRILKPIGLSDTYWGWREADPKRLAPAHASGERVASWTFDGYAPAGSIVSTARDLSRFVRAALGQLDTPANPAIAASMQRIITDDKGTRDGGLAWVLERRGENKLVWHNGQTGGYHSFVGVHPERKLGVVILANDSTPVEPLGYALLTDEPLRPPTKAAPKKADSSLEPFVGNYSLTPQVTAAVTANGKQLFVQLTGQGRLLLKPLESDRFAVEGVEAAITFERTTGSRDISGLVLHQGGIDHRARRLAAGEKAAARKEITLSAEEVEGYVGRYQLAPGVEFTFRREEARLVAQLTGQPAVGIFAEEKDKFFYKVVDAQLTFERDAGGNVTAVVLHQNGRDQRAPRIK